MVREVFGVQKKNSAGKGTGPYSTSKQEREMIEILRRVAGDAPGLCRRVGARMQQARCDWKMSQEFAASMMGYESGAQLSQYESGSRQIPISALRSAAKIYGVSTDFLLCLTDDMEPDPRMAGRANMVRGVRSAVNSAVESIVGAIQESLATEVPASEAINALLPAVEAMLSTVEKFRSLNAEALQDMSAGAPLLLHARELDEALDVAVKSIAGYRKLGAADLGMAVALKEKGDFDESGSRY